MVSPTSGKAVVQVHIYVGHKGNATFNPIQQLCSFPSVVGIVDLFSFEFRGESGLEFKNPFDSISYVGAIDVTV